MRLPKIKKFFLELVFPEICVKCGREGAYLCTHCQTRIKTPHLECLKCSKPSPFGLIHQPCQRRTLYLTGLLTAAAYEDEALRSLIWLLKYSSAAKIAETLSLLLCDFLVAQNLADYFSRSVLTTVPLHKTREKLRGFNQAELLAKHTAQNLKYEYQPLLRKAKKTKRQVDLLRQDRLKNIKNSFALLPGAKAPERVLLIDDVATTGATLNECARILKKAGANEVWGLVLARNK